MAALITARIASTVCVLIGALAMTGCSGAGAGSGGSSSSGSSSSSGGVAETFAQQARRELASCRAGVSDTAFDDALEVTTDFELSLHHLITCGRLVYELSERLITRIAEEALGAPKPTGLAYDGAGRYVSKTENTSSVSVSLRLHRDTSFGKTGDVIMFDLLSLESFFKNPKLSADASVQNGKLVTRVTVSYDALGPAFELLGVPAAPSPMTFDVDESQKQLGRVVLDAKAHAIESHGHAKFVYDTTTPATTIGDVFAFHTVGFALDTLEGGRASLGQAVSVTGFDARSVSDGLTGKVGARVSGGDVPHVATLTYANASTAKIQLACP